MRTRLLACLVSCLLAPATTTPNPRHVDNWAILVDTSRYWFNYRHSVNALAMYEVVKHLGIPDSHILLFLADYPATDPRNRFPGRNR